MKIFSTGKIRRWGKRKREWKRRKEGRKKNSPELLNCFNKVARYKSNIQKSTAFQHTSHEQVEFESKRTVSFSVTQNEYVSVNLEKCINCLYDLYN